MINSVLANLGSSRILHASNYVVIAVTFVTICSLQLAYQVYRTNQVPDPISIINHFVPMAGWKSRSAVMDVVLFLIARFILAGIMISRDTLMILVAPIIVLLATNLGLKHANLPFSLFDIVAFGVLLAMLHDLGNYVTHYMMHKLPTLWEVHKVHHSATFLSPITAFRVHPLETLTFMVGQTIAVAPAVAVLNMVYDVSLLDLLVLLWTANAIISLLFLESLHHSHVSMSFGILDYVVISPRMHQLHHSTRKEHWNKNMGVMFSVWDWLAGTAVRHEGGKSIRYGIGRGPEVDAGYQGIYGLYFRPIATMAQMMIGARRTRATRSHSPPAKANGLVTEGKLRKAEGGNLQEPDTKVIC